MIKRLIVTTALMVLAFAAGAGVVLAHEKSEQTVIKPSEFTIPKGQCSQLAADLEVKGLGLERSKTVVESAHEGDKHGSNEDEGRISYSLFRRITGTATDNLGGKYTFSYQLRLKKPVSLPGSGIVIDTFTLTGTGAANGLSTFVKARVTFDSASNPIAFEILEEAGDPFRCDPL
jgi:hypothetical protein